MGWREDTEAAFDRLNDLYNEWVGSKSKAPAPPPPSGPPDELVLSSATAQVPAVAALAFPGDLDVTWTIERTWSRGNVPLVTARPSRDIGHPVVTFAFRRRGAEAVYGAAYKQAGDGWEKISGDPAAPARIDP